MFFSTVGTRVSSKEPEQDISFHDVIVSIPDGAELDALYQEMLSPSFTWSNGQVPMVKLKDNPVVFLSDGILMGGTPAHIEAIARKHPNLDLNNSSYPIHAASSKNAECLKYLGMKGVNLTRQKKHTGREGDYYGGSPAPLSHAINQLDLRSLAVLAEFNAIKQSGVDVMSAGISWILKTCDQTNASRTDATLQFLFGLLNQDLVFKNSVLEQLASNEAYKGRLESVLQQNQVTILKRVLDFGVDPVMLGGTVGAASIAAQHGSLECLQALALAGVSLGAKINLTDAWCELIKPMFCPPSFPFSILAIPIAIIGTPCFCYLAYSKTESPLKKASTNQHTDCERFIEDWLSHFKEKTNPSQEERTRLY